MTSDIFELSQKEEDLYMQTLREYCATLEDVLREITKTLPDEKGQAIEAYISVRDEMETELLKSWGMDFGTQKISLHKLKIMEKKGIF